MTTSGTTTFDLNARQLITFALSKMLVFGENETPSAAAMATGMETLNAMLKGWQLTGPNLHRQTEGTITLTDATEGYTLDTAPWSISSCRYRSASGVDLPMELLTREEYFNLPLKSSAGVPTTYYYDRGQEKIYVWPVLAAVTTETIKYTYQRKFQDVTALTQSVDIPPEFIETIGYALASRLCDDFSVDDRTAQRITGRAQMLIAQADAGDREPEYRFVPGGRWR